MSDANFASLSSTLLARKGGAKPAMRPQSALITGQSALSAGIEDLGWNDMGSDDEPARDADVLQLTPSPANPETAAEAREIDHEAKDQLEAAAPATPAEPQVRKQQAVLAERISPATGAVSRPAAKRARRAAFTLRLDPNRHLKLRLACTIRNRSAQQIVTEALDALLDAMPDIDKLAAQVERH
ncbi:hypothetical protein [Pelagerythrobacter sp.]|uniref:hypothetical protein n=1 Tax=Pelagerythrobacter sp. TaxID=2800702 RepID=UPI0035ADC0DE